MALPEHVATFLHAGDPVALILVLVLLCFPVLGVVAGCIAMFSAKPEDRSAVALQVLSIVRNRGQSPPSLPSGSPPERLP